ncbi:putative Type IV secretion system protein B4 [Roseovarius sp. EC-HK134]|uniref:VirB4 family type IV secretion/conjugal transfer ATPase n=1 Tax=unclassified Roseovarius TaxID=2614913 RepID=UPI00125107F8|nr:MULTISPECIES: type IV secretion system protein B4 [unclassified Roseovarius]VVS98239.1 putative Type IV secretion system protein B4 [Roseovarius sp. EC-SD190]VVS99219.1 putative Type IV secretion system protein B4 [Roseovarius sp. EC-HK134]
MAFDAGLLSNPGNALLGAGGRDFTRESYLAEHLPYFALASDDVMVLREGDLMATLRLDGLNPMTTEDAHLDALKRAVAAIVAQTGNAFGFYIHRFSVPQDLVMRTIEGGGFAAAIDAHWQAHIKDLRPAKRQLYLSVLRRPDISARIPLFRNLARKAWIKDRATRMQELNEVMSFFEVALASANPVRLTRTGGEWLGFLNTLNAGSFSPVAVCQSALPLSHTLSTCRATFGGNVVTLTDVVTGAVKYGALFSLKSYPALTDVTLLDALDLPLDIVLTNSFNPIPNNIMAERIQRIIRQMQASEDAAVSLRDQLGQAADDQEAGRIAFGDHHLSIAVYASDRDTVERAAAQIKRVGQEIMAVIVRESMALKATYFAQSPGNFGYRARKTPISSINFADFAALHGSVEGRGPGQSPWGQTISVLPSVGTSGYRFNFHEAGSPGKEPTVGHTLVLGRTGSGKTLTAAFLAAQSQRVGARLFFFDKDRGHEMAVRALGGRYNEIRAGVATGLNPLMTEIDERGRAWLSDWLATLLTRNGALTGEQSRHIQSAVGQNAEAGAALQRFASFETLFQSLDDEGELQSRVAEWAPGGRYGWVFDEPVHGRGLKMSGDIIGFDMTEILDMTIERMAVLSYIFRQIERLVEDRRPTIIVLDEAWKLLDDPYFGARLENWLVTLRKMNCVVIMMTQYPSQLQGSRAGKTIVETVPTQILFPNDRATISDYDFLRVNAKEAALLVQPTLGQRIALVRSAGDSVFVDADLSALGDLLPILCGGATGEARVPADWRTNPDFWRHVI